MQLRMLGPLQVVHRDGHVLTKSSASGDVDLPTEALAQVTLIVLAQAEGQPVTAEKLARILYGESFLDEVDDWKNAVQKRISTVRNCFKMAGEEPLKRLRTSQGTYVLSTQGAYSCDYSEYLSRLRETEAVADLSQRVSMLQEALNLWRGDPSESLRRTEPGSSIFDALRDSRMVGQIRLLGARAQLKGFASVLNETRELTQSYPDQEALLEIHIRALAESGDPDSATAAYQDYRERAKDGGREPGSDLRAVAAQIKQGGQGASQRDAYQRVRDYLGRVLQASSRLNFGDATRSALDEPQDGAMTLEQVWTPLQVALQPAGAGRLESKTEEMPALQALDQPEHQAVVLLGNPGGGKSTIIAFRTSSLAREALGQRDAPIPVRVRLSEVKTSAEPDIDDLWTGVREAHRRPPSVELDTDLTRNLTRAYLATGRATLLFDGLDEVQEDQLQGVLSLIRLCRNAYQECRIVATCRTFDYELNQPLRRLPFPALELLPFTLEQQLDYVDHWYDALAALSNNVQLTARKANLRSSLEQNDHLVKMGATPLLTALMALVHTQDGELPEARAILYKRAIQYLLAESPMWRERHEGSALASQDMVQLAARVGYEYHRRQETSEKEFRGLREQDLQVLVQEHLNVFEARPGTRARTRLQEEAQGYLDRLVQSNGLLVDQGAGYYDFTFKQYREFLAGLHLGAVMEEDETLQIAARPHWRECFQLLASHAGSDTNISYLLNFISDLADEQRPDYKATDALLGAEMLQEIGRELLIKKGLGRVLRPGTRAASGLWPRIAAAILPLLSANASTAPPAVRIRAATALGNMGDPRFVDPEDGTLRTLPDRLITLSPTTLEVGVDPNPEPSGRRRLDEQPVTAVKLSFRGYSIGRYLVTNAEFKEFVADDGYRDGRWWSTTYEGAQWRVGDPAFIESLERTWIATASENYAKELADGTYAWETLSETARDLCRPRQEPYFFDNRRFNQPTQPVVGVNFWECLAYCEWLTHVGQRDGWLSPPAQIRPPSEWEWERATTGNGTLHVYPWGDHWDPALARTKYDGTELAHAAPVGCYPNGTWAAGPLDLAGNVWEWTSSRLLGYSADNDPDREDPATLAERSIRGSSWYDLSARRNTQSAVRYLDLPGNVYFDLGFRVVVSDHPDSTYSREG